MIDPIQQGLQDIKSIEASYEGMRKRLHEYRFDIEQLRSEVVELREENERMRQNLGNALLTIERYQREEGETPHD